MVLKLIVVLAVLTCTLPMFAVEQDSPSFDCEKATSKSERLICKTGVSNGSTLRKLDVAMSNAFKAVKDRNGDVKKSQLSWLKTRESCVFPDDGATVDCLIDLYNKRLSELLSAATLYEKTVNKASVCFVVTGRQCPSNSIQEFGIGTHKGFFFNNGGRSYLIELSDDDSIDWDSSWSGSYIGYVDSFQTSYWKKQSSKLPAYLVIKGNYRDGCPDCGTQDTLFFKVDQRWQPLNLAQFYSRLGLVTASAEELYMFVDDNEGAIRITAAFSDYREAQVEDLSYMTAIGYLQGNVFVPTEFKLAIR